MGWFSRTASTLDDIGTGASARLDVVVVSPDALESAIASTRAAVFRWTLLVQRSTHGSSRSGGGSSSKLTVFASGWRGGPIVVRAMQECSPRRTRTGVEPADGRGRRGEPFDHGCCIEVALDAAKLEVPTDPEDGVPLGSTPQSAQLYGEVARRAPPDGGPVYVREYGIVHGQALTLVGRVVPVAVESGYRVASTSRELPFRTEGALTLEDHTLDL